MAGPTNCSGCPVLSNAVFRALPTEARSDALCLFHPIDAPPGSPFLRQGRPVERVYALCRGGAKAYRTDVDGRHQVVRAFRPGDVVGLGGLLLQESPVTVETTTAARLCWADRQAFLDAMDHSPALGRAMLRGLSEDLAEAREEMQDLATPSPLRRVARYLVRELDRSEGSERGVLHLPLSWADSASLLGLARSAFEQAVGRLEDLGILTRRGEALCVRAPDRLGTMAGRPPQEDIAGPVPGFRPRLLA